MSSLKRQDMLMIQTRQIPSSTEIGTASGGAFCSSTGSASRKKEIS